MNSPFSQQANTVSKSKDSAAIQKVEFQIAIKKAESELEIYNDFISNPNFDQAEVVQKNVTEFVKLLEDATFTFETFISLLDKDFNFVLSAITGLSLIKKKDSDYLWSVANIKLKNILEKLDKVQKIKIYDFVIAQPSRFRKLPKGTTYYKTGFSREESQIIKSPTISAAISRIEKFQDLASSVAFGNVGYGRVSDQLIEFLSQTGLDLDSPSIQNLLKAKMAVPSHLLDSPMTIGDIFAVRHYLELAGLLRKQTDAVWRPYGNPEMLDDLNRPVEDSLPLVQEENYDANQSSNGLVDTSYLLEVNQLFNTNYSQNEFGVILDNYQKITYYRDDFLSYEISASLNILLGVDNPYLVKIVNKNEEVEKVSVKFNNVDEFGTLENIIGDLDLGGSVDF